MIIMWAQPLHPTVTFNFKEGVQVESQSASKESWILRDHSYITSKGMHINLTDINAINQNLATFNLDNS